MGNLNRIRNPKLALSPGMDNKQRMAGKLADRVALVTGASRGIGEAIALRFAAEGAAVAVHFRRNGEMAERVCERIASDGGKAVPIQGDVGDAEDIPALVEGVLDRFGRIDILVNNAGIFLPTSISEAVLADIEKLMQVNVLGLIRVSRAVIPGMIDRRYGKVVNIASVAAMGTRMEGTSGYAATKAAVVAITKRTACEVGQYGINVNAIAPGLIRTDMGLADSDPAKREEKERLFASNASLGRIGEPADIAHAALFLASEEASFITGQVVVVDGGRFDYLTHSM